MYLLGIHPDGDYFKVALVQKRGREKKILFLQEFKKDILDLNQLKKKVLKETKYRQEEVDVITALSPDEVFVRSISFPFKRKSSIAKALPFQLEKVLPFSQEVATAIPQINVGKKGSVVTLYTYLNENLEQHIQEIKTLGFDPDSVVPLAKALHRFARFLDVLAPSYLIFHLGWETSHLVYVKEGVIKHSLTLEFGFKGFVDSVKKGVPMTESIDYPLICQMIKKGEEVVADELAHAKKALFRSLEFLRRKEECTELPLLCTGHLAVGEEIVSSLEGFSFPRVERGKGEIDLENMGAYAIEIGLALEGGEGGKDVVELRQGSFTAARQIAKVKKKALFFLTLTALTSCAFFSTLFFTAVKQTQLARDRFQRVIALADDELKSYPKLEKALFSSADCAEESRKFLKAFNKERIEENFFQTPPAVHHLLLALFENKGEGIEIESIDYRLDSYPHAENPRAPMSALIELSFTAESEEKGREFWEKFLSQIGEKGVVTKGEGNVFHATVQIQG